MAVSDVWSTTLERMRPDLLAWAETQTPHWARSKLDPADLVQQTMMEGLRAAEKLAGKPDHEVLSYLRRVLSNNAIDAARKHRHTDDDVSLDASAESSGRLADWLAADGTSPSERVARQERYQRLAASLAQLPDSQRIAIEWKYLHGAPVAEIARVLNKTEGAVMALLHRAVMWLRQKLNQSDF
jgi:RNA polymerase sigma-70 factor (ECF subfamily)